MQSFSKLLEEVLSPALFFQFGSSGLVICCTVYLLSVVSFHEKEKSKLFNLEIICVPQSNPLDNVSKFVVVIMFLTCIVAQILMPSFFGSRLLDESEGITNAMFSSQWMDRNLRCKRAYMIFVERTFHPMAIFAGRLFLLSLPIFVRVSSWRETPPQI